MDLRNTIDAPSSNRQGELRHLATGKRPGILAGQGQPGGYKNSIRHPPKSNGAPNSRPGAWPCQRLPRHCSSPAGWCIHELVDALDAVSGLVAFLEVLDAGVVVTGEHLSMAAIGEKPQAGLGLATIPVLQDHPGYQTFPRARQGAVDKIITLHGAMVRVEQSDRKTTRFQRQARSLKRRCSVPCRRTTRPDRAVNRA